MTLWLWIDLDAKCILEGEPCKYSYLLVLRYRTNTEKNYQLPWTGGIIIHKERSTCCKAVPD